MGLTDQGRHRWDTVEECMAGGHRQSDSPRPRCLGDSDLWEQTLGALPSGIELRAWTQGTEPQGEADGRAGSTGQWERQGSHQGTDAA